MSSGCTAIPAGTASGTGRGGPARPRQVSSPTPPPAHKAVMR